MGERADVQGKMASVLVCFAMKEEARFFAASQAPRECRVLITGVGRRNAGKAFGRAIAGEERPRLVISAGYVGGLNPALALGTVVVEADAETGLAERLARSGAVAGRFHCVDRVAVSAAEKAALWQATGADAVEMESAVIRALCREKGIPSATVRVISDAAGEDLPLDFNALMTPDERLSYARLAWAVATSPAKIGALLRFQRQTASAGRKLAAALHKALGP
jgi:adenosylhomocysteine nucleosidase